MAGSDPNTLIDLADQIEAVMRTVPGVVDIQNLDAARSPEGQLVVDRRRAVDLELSPAQIAGTLRTAISGSPVGEYKPTGETAVDITLLVTEEVRNNQSKLLQLPLAYRDGQPIRLEQVTTVERSQAPARITRTNRQQTLTVGSGLAGRTTGEVAADSETVEKGELAGIFGRDESGNWLYVITSSLSPGWLPADTLRVIGDMTEAPVLPPNPLAAFANTITSSAASVDSTTPPPTVAELSPITTAQVNVEVVNLRQGPGPNYSQLGMLTGQDQVELLAVNKLKDWALIKTADGVTGWVGLEFLNPGGSVADAPVVLSARS